MNALRRLRADWFQIGWGCAMIFAIIVTAALPPRPQAAQTSMQLPWVYTPAMDWGALNPPSTTVTLKNPPAIDVNGNLVCPLLVVQGGQVLNPTQYKLTGKALTIPATGQIYQVFYCWGANNVSGN
jgi:hypothetical protein